MTVDFYEGGDLMTNSAELRARIDSLGLRYNYLAQQLGLTPYGLALKINNTNEFKISEVARLCELLNIKSLKERDRIFFAKNVV